MMISEVKDLEKNYIICFNVTSATGGLVLKGKPKWQYGLEKYEKCNVSLFDF
jgi:hypothetical protein